MIQLSRILRIKTVNHPFFPDRLPCVRLMGATVRVTVKRNSEDKEMQAIEMARQGSSEQFANLKPAKTVVKGDAL